jgi:SAM-dependent methyltransferase
VFGGWDPQERAMIPFIASGDRVLVAGCGTGRDLLALAAMGCPATGVDPVPAAIAAAGRILRERQLDIPVHVGFFDEVPLDGEYDIVIFSGMCSSYIPERARRTAALRKAAALLAPSGRIFLTYVPCQQHAWRRSVAVGRFAGWLCRADWRVEPGDVLTIDDETGAPFYEHWFVPGELEGEVEEAGLRLTFQAAAPIPFAIAVPPKPR